MDEVDGFCVRMLGPGEAAEEAARTARAGEHGDRLALLARAAADCRQRQDATPAGPDEGETGPVRPADPESADADRGAEPATGDPAGPTEPESAEDPRGEGEGSTASTGDDPATLAQTVATELAQATAHLPERQRETLALREALGLSHAEMAQVLGVDTVAVAALVARARLRLRLELRGESAPSPECLERDRALRTMALRQDGEDVAGVDDDWLVEHLGHCEGCGRAHAAMLEASACYRAWRLPQAERAATGA